MSVQFSGGSPVSARVQCPSGPKAAISRAVSRDARASRADRPTHPSGDAAAGSRVATGDPGRVVRSSAGRGSWPSDTTPRPTSGAQYQAPKALSRPRTAGWAVAAIQRSSGGTRLSCSCNSPNAVVSVPRITVRERDQPAFGICPSVRLESSDDRLGFSQAPQLRDELVARLANALVAHVEPFEADAAATSRWSPR